MSEIMDQLYGLISMTWTQILGVLILSIMYKLGLLSLGKQKSKEKHISCDSPNCVRCRAYTAGFIKSLHRDWQRYESNLSERERGEVDRISRTISQYVTKVCTKRQPMFQLFDLPTTPYHEPASFASDVELLERTWGDIHSEYLNLSKTQGLSSSWKVNSTPKGKWSAFYLVNQGVEITENIARCPKTYTVLRELRSFMRNCLFGNACFSVVHPDTHITEHYGPCNLRVRCHLGIDVPDGCELIVDGVKKSWFTGKCLLFDDCYLHSVTHVGSEASSRPRVVLLVDFWNAHISFPERRALSCLFHACKINSKRESA